MTRIEILKSKIDLLYEAKNPERAEWADWLHKNHIFVVADNARKLSERFGGTKDLAEASGMLHDVADIKMARENSDHENESKILAKKLLEESGFLESEIGIIVDDAIAFHGCHGGDLPQTLDGKILATADAMAHLQTEFYKYGIDMMSKTDSQEEIRDWALAKIERDYRKKIFFEEIRKELQGDYEQVKSLFES